MPNPNQSCQSRFPEPNIPVDGCVQRENAGFLAPQQTMIRVSGKVSINGGATVPLPTPPQGKIWLLTDILLSHDGTAAVEFKINVGNVPIFDWPVKGDTAPFNTPNIETQFDIPQSNTSQLVMGSLAANGYFALAGVQQDIGNG